LFSNREVGAPLPMQAIVGGVDQTGPHLFNLDPYGSINLDPYGSITEEVMVSTGSGSPYAYGVLEAQFQEGKTVQFQEGKTVEEMLKVVVRAVDSAMKRDVASGDSFDIVVITKQGYRELSSQEKKALLNS